MATIIWKEAKGTAKSRYKARRAAKIEQVQQDASLARRIEQKLSGCVRADRATSLVALRDYQEPEVTERKRNPAYKNPVNHPTHLINAHQKMRGKSIPLI
ncbi:regulator [Cronobacter sakazakii]|uniref:regulator n=1 Tax=Cronobacter sakazakii TaxID=28141 RepID=UPI000DA20767|nr:regulator [Cronobacter sakazakii]EKF1803344.1 regulator [Cronobacter sakazakii]EKY2023531.1 regulator [Cronobacter sakazakii]EKY2075617.1 regulator [Cronobacter sakazakii]EKY2088213.1 regulator [Cronobacter sakazakii]EMC4187757.1 regulator [Cronobacter sakazakii]